MAGGCLEVERRVLRLLHGHKNRNSLSAIHAHFLRHHLHQSNLVLAQFVLVCGSLNRMRYATLIFCQTQNPNILLYNAMIKGVSLCGPFEEALGLYSGMRSRGMCPDRYTFAPLIKSCVGLSGCGIGEGIHGGIVVSGLDSVCALQVGIVELYASFGRMKEARKMFDEMPRRSVIVWNLLIRGFCKRGDIEMGLEMFGKMSEQSIVTWNSMIGSLGQSGRDEEALGLLREMWDGGLEPDEATVATVLPICARMGAADVGDRIHSFVRSSGLWKKYISVGNALVDFYCKCGNLDIAAQVFDEMPRKNVVSWNSLIFGLSLNGQGELGIRLFEDMMQKGLKPNEVTFLGALACCAHAGLIEKGREIFNSMINKHHTEPKHEHYGSIVDILGRGGCTKEAYVLIRSMPMEPNAALWGALLGACRTHGDLEHGEYAVKELINLEPNNSGNYILLSNMYAEEGRWDEVENIRVLLKDKSVRKEPGHSAVV
uniref:Pentatricopeptide repeat-containing protein n=1 Tax=Kalanchoe fedtschenkoi TaxID=63787 RepID=A0A7N0VLB0_KALFE